MIPYNKVCSLEDFDDPAISDLIREIFFYEIGAFPQGYPNGVADSKQWEIAMSVRTLRDTGLLNRSSKILGVGAGTEVTSFYLTRHVEQVFATDIYAASKQWVDVAPLGFLANPALFSPYEFDQSRLVPLHMDARVLRFPDKFFDGIYSSGSIEHFGSLEYVANAAYEIGRVLKPGGVATIATEFKLAGPPGSDGWDPNVILFTNEKLEKYIIEASGLEPIDELDTSISDATLKVRRDLVPFLRGTSGEFSAEKKIAHYPNLVLYHEGYLFCSVHVALKKSDRYPAKDNGWAAPSESTRELVAKTFSPSEAVPGADLLKLMAETSTSASGGLDPHVSKLVQEQEQFIDRLRSEISYRDHLIKEQEELITKLRELVQGR
ncbi:class I SAM-dependent methyltransferase [Microvirga guangxiensis]|uniref:Methyltransferase domain-containing protein n=1 Tax=Microvirga guangxiensis TaxID=549386 RepID=A0A1G5CFK7_9HYPH|nr:class I SAM-dependent methyltransferase [Microvirga guangxiensis]SCY01094.1 Methyltransferase domain-containing protein [Microvirga guangxiensis]